MAEEFIIDYLTGQNLPDSDMERLLYYIYRHRIKDTTIYEKVII